MRQLQNSRRAGFALPAVLATLIVLTLVAVASGRFVNEGLQRHQTERKVAQIDQDIDSAFVIALSLLHDNKHPSRAVLMSGGSIVVGRDTSPIRVTMTRNNTQFDLNMADERLLHPVLIAALGEEIGEIAFKRATESRTADISFFDVTELLPRHLAQTERGARLTDLFTVQAGQKGDNAFNLSKKMLRIIPELEREFAEALKAISAQGGIKDRVTRLDSTPFFSSGTDIITLVASSAGGRSRALTARMVQGVGQFEVLAVRSIPAPLE